MEEKIEFEVELKKLETISNNMSSKGLPLEKSIEYYEEGMKIVKKLEEALKEASQKVEQIIEIK